jgi:hypothetical protein
MLYTIKSLSQIWSIMIPVMQKYFGRFLFLYYFVYNYSLKNAYKIRIQDYYTYMSLTSIYLTWYYVVNIKYKISNLILFTISLNYIKRNYLNYKLRNM